MHIKFLKKCLIGLVLSVSCLINVAKAGLIDVDSILLDNAGATNIETWLGQGDLDWKSIWYGSSGATSTSWHEAVDGVGPTVSIYDVSYNGNNYLVGGYTDLDWGGNSFKTGGGNSFIFDLLGNSMFEFQQATGGQEIFGHNTHFATFSDGHDLYGGIDVLGENNGYSYDWAYTDGEEDAGQLIGVQGRNLTINALETFTFTTVQNIPEPSILAIFVLGIMCLASRQLMKQD